MLTSTAKRLEPARPPHPFQKINGQDQKAYILSVNINRRHMSAGQRAMAVAMIYPEAAKGRGKKDAALKGDVPSSFSQRRLQIARSVLKDSHTVARAFGLWRVRPVQPWRPFEPIARA
jgi:hypothetical protein